MEKVKGLFLIIKLRVIIVIKNNLKIEIFGGSFKVVFLVVKKFTFLKYYTVAIIELLCMKNAGTHIAMDFS